MSTMNTLQTLPAGMHYTMGVDGGGTSTRARLRSRDGRVLGEGRSGPSGLMQGIAQAWNHVEQAIAQAEAQALAQADALAPTPGPHNTVLGLGLAGANVPALKQQFLQANTRYPLLRLESDAFVALLGAHAGAPGAMVIAGTGSVGQALFADGRRALSGGWGFPSGDDGSGAWLGLHAVNLAQRVLDGRQAPGVLASLVLQTTANTPEGLLAWCCQAGQRDYASLAPLVFDCESFDAQAAALVGQSLQAITQLALALDPSGSLPLVVLGSIGKRLAERLPDKLQQRLVAAQGDAMDGALALCSERNLHMPSKDLV